MFVDVSDGNDVKKVKVIKVSIVREFHGSYFVKKVQNGLTPTPGHRIKEKEIQTLIDNPRYDVTIYSSR